jgi:diadenosine tetraphosphatase ApaH/serine/threonine PP2A family protein phosphatase
MMPAWGSSSLMRVLIISDIHANLVALEAVLAEASRAEYEAVWCLGDLVGYGPHPNECTERVRGLPGLKCLVGNHDKAVLGEIDLNAFNADARAALAWTRSQCTPRTLDYLASLPAQDRYEKFTLAHGSPRQPVWEYVLDCSIAQACFEYFDTPYCLIGHTHVPVVFREAAPGGECLEAPPDYEHPLALGEQRLILNPGSVGQPRDNNPRAAYAVLDTAGGVLEYRRVAYDVLATQSQIRAAELPERLATRLALGW